MSYEYQEPSLNCFDNLIGIKGNCGALQVPDSGLFLQDLPMISLDNLDSAISKEHQSAFDELERKLELAQILTVGELRTALSSRFKINTVLETGRFGFIQENLQTRAAKNKYIGGQIKVLEYPYTEVTITRIGLHVQTSGPVNVDVVDLISGKVLDTIVVTAVADTPTYKDVFKKYKTNGQRLNLYLAYDDTGIDSYKTLINSTGTCSTCNGGFVHSYLGYSTNRAASMDLGGQLIDENLVSESETGGLMVYYELSCDLEKYACSIKYQLAQCIWYRSGILILDEIIASHRFTNIVRLFEQDHKDVRDYYQKMFDRQLKYMLNNMVMPKDICFHCEPRYVTQTVLP